MNATLQIEQERDFSDIKAKINADIEMLIGRIETNKDSIKNTEKATSDDDIATETEIHAKTTSAIAIDTNSIKRLRTALVRMDNGDFGYCDECGVEISMERLKAVPASVDCVDCLTIKEREAKQRM